MTDPYRGLGFALERQFVTPQGRRVNQRWTTLPGAMQ